MSRDNHLRVPDDPASRPQRRIPRPSSPYDVDDGLESLFNFPSPTRRPSLRDIDIANGVPRSPPHSSFSLPQQPTMAMSEEQIQQLQELALQQAKALEESARQLQEVKSYSDGQTEQLRESQRQLEMAHNNITDLTSAFRDLSAHPRASTSSSAPKKKPELPPFDSKNVIVWIRRVEAAYSRVGVIEPKDKFAWMESIFQVKLDPQIDAYLYNSTNSAQDWEDFINYLKMQYGPTIRQKAQKIMGECPRHDLRPSQYLLQLKEDVKDVEIDHVFREHVLKSLPARIREYLGKEVENMSAEQVAQAADKYFDRQGRPTEKSLSSISHVTTASTSSSAFPQASAASTFASTSSSSFTQAFSDEETDVNFVRNNNYGGNNNNRGRNNNRGQRSRSRPRGSRFPNASSTGGSSNSSFSSSFPPGTCHWHRKFGEKSFRCQTDCPQFKSHQAKQQQQGNANGGRRQ